MQLFDLPTELAQLAFDHIVMSRWCKRAMRIRIVNRQFKAYVDDSIFRLGLLRNLSISTIQTIDRNLYDRFVHQASLSYICSYISYRVLRDHSTTSLLGRVRQAAKTLCENDGNTETEAIMACANFLIPLALENEVFDRLLEERETDGSDNSDDLKADIYVAAIYLSKKSYVERLIADGIKFCELPGRLGVCSTIFGDDLSAAAMRGNLDMIELLLSYTSEYHQTGVLSFSEQWGIIWGASRYGHEAAFDFALDKRTIIYSDISIEADIRMLKEIIRVIPIPKNFERAARIIGPFDGSWSTSWLQRSARRGHVQMVRYFLDKGVKPNHITLVLAIGAGNETIVRMLLDAGADPNLPGPMYTALGNAVWKGSESIVKLLLSHSVDINEGSPPPIAIAVLKENMEMFRLLRDNGARLDTPETGRNLLKSVKEKGLSSMVDVL
ncbi:ankyrin repeat-containing domain protein [Xylaria flabelliformis]|nr:ankyrin repeat-containing domain protein [Xylaria flabelliformis]